jgi:hypothetical protein
MVLPIPAEGEKLPPQVVITVDAYNLKLLATCIGRQDTLIDVVNDYNKRRK